MLPLRRFRHTVREATALAPIRPAYAAGVRAAIATVWPLVLLGQSYPDAAMWMSIGGFNGALADRGGPYRTRAATMGAVTLGIAIAAALGTLAGGRLFVAIAVTFLVALIASLARVWGMAGATVGGSALTTYVIALAFPAAGIGEAFTRSGYAIAGGLGAMVIALILWPLQPYRPARLAVGRGYRSLAGYADDVGRHIQAIDVRASSELPAGSATVRGALEDARLVLARMRRGRSGATGREERLVVLGEVVDQIFGHLVAMAEMVDSIPRAKRIAAADDAVRRAIAMIASTARALADAVEAERRPLPIPLDWNGEPVRAVLPDADSGDVSDIEAVLHYRQGAAILDRAAQYAGVAAETVAALNDGRTESPTHHTPATYEAPDDAEERVSPLAILRDVLAPDSLILRYALRVAVVTTVAVALAELLQIKRGYWMTITAIVILQPYTGVTTSRALQRVVGTVLGGLLTAALGAVFHDSRAILVLSFLFAATCVALLPVNYAAFSVFLTPTFVLLAEASAGDWHLASTRVLNTLLGGALALLGSRLLWPSPEWSRFPGYMTDALRANRDYLRCVAEHFGDRSVRAGETIREARRRIGLATANAEESFQRLLGEYDGTGERVSAAITFLTYTRRLTASIAALALVRHSAPENADAALGPFMRIAMPVLDDLAASIMEQRRPAPLPILVSDATMRPADRSVPLVVRARVDRLARQIRLLHDVADRWTNEPSWDQAPRSRDSAAADATGPVQAKAG